MSEAIETPTGVVELTRTFAAPVDRVYRAFTEGDRLAKWACGTSYENIALDIDPRPGGVYHHRVRFKGDGSEWTFFGVYQAVEPNRSLSYTFDWKQDWRQPGTPSLVEITFRDRGERTALEIRHSQMAEPGLESTETHWKEFIEVLDELLTGGQL